MVYIPQEWEARVRVICRKLVLAVVIGIGQFVFDF